MPVEPKFAVVSKDQSLTGPYPFVFINADGGARELHDSEKQFLETPFSPFDGGRPYVKNTYSQQDGWGSIRGFLHRSALPDGVDIESAPSTSPLPLASKEDQIELMRKHGFELKNSDSGKMTFERVRDKRK